MTKLAKVVCDIKSVLSDGDIRDLRAACKKTNSLGRKTKILKKTATAAAYCASAMSQTRARELHVCDSCVFQQPLQVIFIFDKEN